MDPAQLVLDSLSDAVVVASGEGLVSGWLGGAEPLLGYSAEEAIGRPVSFLFARSPERDLEELASLGGAPGIDILTRVRHRSGREFPAAISVRPMTGGAGTVALFRPMGQRRADPEWDRVLGRLLRELIELAGADRAVLDRTDALARVLVEQGRRIVPGTECLMSLVPHDLQDSFQIIAGAGPWAEGLVGGQWPRAGTIAGQSMDRRRPIETVRLIERSALRTRLEAGGIHTGRLIPLLTREPLPDGRWALGVFGFYRREIAYFTPYQRRLMNEFVRLASLTLQRTELIAATARAAGRLQVGVEAAYDLASTLARSLHAVNKLGAFFDIIHQDPVLSQVKLIAEPWDVGEGGYQVGNFPVLWTEWNGKYRDSVRQFWRGEGASVSELATRLAGSNDLYAQSGRQPYASINFVTAHDGFTLHDLVAYNEKHNENNREDNQDGENNNLSWNCGAEGPTDDPEIRALRERQKRNLLATMLLSQGVPMISHGDELGRTQRGNNNAYCQDNEISWIDWNLDADRRTLLEFVCKLVRFRRAQPALRRRKYFHGRSIRGAKDVAWLAPDGREMDDAAWQAGFVRTLGMQLSGSAIEEVNERGEPITGDTLLVLLNGHTDKIPFTLPPLEPEQQWQRVFDTFDPHTADRTFKAGARYPLQARSVAFFKILSPLRERRRVSDVERAAEASAVEM